VLQTFVAKVKGDWLVHQVASFDELRKSYLKLSLVLHPDRNRGIPDATKAFQALVKAFETVSAPDWTANKEQDGKGHAKLARTNKGCYRTRVRKRRHFSFSGRLKKCLAFCLTQIYCPRCKEPWGAKVEGNPEYYYNFLMC